MIVALGQVGLNRIRKQLNLLIIALVTSLLAVVSVRHLGLHVHIIRPTKAKIDLVADVSTINTTLFDDDVISGTTPRHVIGRMRMSGGRLGNEMFVYAAVIGIAARNGMIPVYRSQTLRQVFNMTSSQSPEAMNPLSISVMEYSAFKHDDRFDRLRLTYAGDVTVVGFFQSWKYFRSAGASVRREFSFLSQHREPAERFLRTIVNGNRLDGNVVFVGVHIRRGDMMANYNVAKGYTVADEDYLVRAVSRMNDAIIKQDGDYSRPVNVVYIVCTDDQLWTRQHFDSAISRINIASDDVVKESSKSSDVISWLRRAVFGQQELRSRRLNVKLNVTVVYSSGNSAEHDLAMLSRCNHTIMTVGTYGWWAGYLAGGITIYYKDFPANGSMLEGWFSKIDFFPPEWIGL